MNGGALARVGDTPAAPAGFAPIFPEWNVWQFWGSEEPNQGLSGLIFNTGLSLQRQAQIWAEDTIKEAPGVAVADPLNPAALKGDQIQILPNAGTLSVLLNRAEGAPLLAGAQQLGDEGSKAILYTVRFWNRGTPGLMPWPHDENYLLENVFQPDPANPLTSGPAPSSLAGAASAAGEGLKDTLKVVAVVAGVGLGLVLILSLVNASRKAAA
jgi:hypothetical protein